MSCEGPLIWYVVPFPDDDPPREEGILYCTQCRYLIVTGWWHDEAHSSTPFLFEGLAS